ncbi:MAG TPA: hypothetical protein VIL25_01160 [Vicinamibacterales bacterium]
MSEHGIARMAAFAGEPGDDELLDEELEHVVGGLNRAWIAGVTERGGAGAAVPPVVRGAWPAPLPVGALAEP